MKLEEALICLNEEEIFGKVHSVDVEESNVIDTGTFFLSRH